MSIQTETAGAHPWTAAAMSRLVDSLTQSKELALAERIQTLAERLTPGRVTPCVAFCGLFSAGKSSVINALTESSQLATGAVPTTARVAQVAWGTPGHPLTLLDTPGIDSTVNEDQVATEAGLTQADVVLLVADYAHVEADANLEWARYLASRDKRFAVIVHQIDKHLDWELPFAAFADRLAATFTLWDVAPERIFYTSKQPCDHNELSILRAWLLDFAEHADAVVAASVHTTVRQWLEEWQDARLASHRAALADQVQAAIGQMPLGREDALVVLHQEQAQASELAQQLAERKDGLEAELTAAKEQFLRSVELAQIAPYETMERGRSYVESLRPGFRVAGWLHAQSRIDNERDNRLRRFVVDLADRTQKFLVWPLQSALRQWLQSDPRNDVALLGDLAAVDVRVDDELCRAAVKQGALVSEQYSYQYVRDVVNTIKGNLTARLDDVLELWFASCRTRLAADLAELTAELAEHEAAVDALGRWLAVDDERDQEVAAWLNSASSAVTDR